MLSVSAIYLFAFALGFQLIAASFIVRFARHGTGGHAAAHAHGHGRFGHGHARAHTPHVRGHAHAAHAHAAHAHAAHAHASAHASAAQRVGDAALHVAAQLLNIAALGALLCIGGAVGIIGAQLGSGRGVTAVVAVLSGLVVAIALAAVPRWIEQKTSYLDPWSAEGTIATVLNRIVAGRTGEILFAREGARACLPAVSATGVALEPGTEVVVLEMQRGVARVAPSAEVLGEVDKC